MCRGFNFPPKYHFMPYSCNTLEAQSVHLQSDQLLFRCLDEHARWNRKYGCKTQSKGLGLAHVCIDIDLSIFFGERFFFYLMC